MNKQSGQTLIEVVAAISIASVVLGGLVVVVLNGLRNAKFAQNQALATKYGQDSLEEIRAIRDRNSIVLGNSNVHFSCYFGSCSTTVNPPETTPACLTSGAGGGAACYFNLSDAYLQLTEISSATAQSTPDSLGNGFTRSIKLSDTTPFSPTEKVFTVIVSWVDISGSHRSNLQTNLTLQ